MKVAILGTENSHAWVFSERLLGKDGTKYFPELDLIGVYGDKNTEDGQLGNEKVAEGSACPDFADHYNDYLDEADAIMVTARDGKNHLTAPQISGIIAWQVSWTAAWAGRKARL